MKTRRCNQEEKEPHPKVKALSWKDWQCKHTANPFIYSIIGSHVCPDVKTPISPVAEAQPVAGRLLVRALRLRTGTVRCSV